MDIRSSLEGLKSLLGTAPAALAPAQQSRSQSAGASLLGSDHATFSSAGNEVSQSLADSGVRMDKVSAVQSALAAGSYNVAPSAVASKVVDSMLGGQS